MKKITFLFIAILAFSCSSDDDSTENDSVDAVFNYFPLTQGTFWIYNNDAEQTTTRDSLYIAGVEETNGINYTILGAEQPATAFMTTFLSQNKVRLTDSQFLLTGEIGAPVDGFPEITIPLEDLILFDKDAATDEVLSNLEGEIEQVINEIPVLISYELKTVEGETFTNYLSFTDVLSSKLIVNMAITAQFEVAPGIVIPINILASQDILKVTNYYANEIGLIDSETIIEYQLQDLSDFGIELPFPSEDSRTATQVIDTYNIAN
ncbi:MAG: hypothetical protein L3J09_05700 [Flavobacteriaceae bacterium]|nr:hypothetical protein [Flavobacteriaceae bacterium]